MNPPATTGMSNAPTRAALRERFMRNVQRELFSNINAAGNAIPARLDYDCSGVSGKEEASPPCLAHKDFHESATPERKRFRVNRNPSGEMLMVNGSPSISISRRMVFSSLVGMRLLGIHAGTAAVR